MNKLIHSIKATVSGEMISLDIQGEDEDYNALIEAKIYSNSTFRFSYIHPENNKSNSYTGFIEGNKVYLYPQHGEAILTDKFILIDR